jgi:hypothetical protein
MAPGTVASFFKQPVVDNEFDMPTVQDGLGVGSAPFFRWWVIIILIHNLICFNFNSSQYKFIELPLLLFLPGEA